MTRWIDMRLLDTDQGVLKRMNERVRTQTHANNVCNDIFVDLKCETYLSLWYYWYGVIFLLRFFNPKMATVPAWWLCEMSSTAFWGFCCCFLQNKMFGLTWSCCSDKSSVGDMLAKWFWYSHLHTDIHFVCAHWKQFEMRSFGMEKSKIRSYKSNWNANDPKCIQWFKRFVSLDFLCRFGEWIQMTTDAR